MVGYQRQEHHGRRAWHRRAACLMEARMHSTNDECQWEIQLQRLASWWSLPTWITPNSSISHGHQWINWLISTATSLGISQSSQIDDHASLSQGFFYLLEPNVFHYMCLDHLVSLNITHFWVLIELDVCTGCWDLFRTMSPYWSHFTMCLQKYSSYQK